MRHVGRLYTYTIIIKFGGQRAHLDMTFRLGVVFNSGVDIGHDLFEGLAGLGVDGGHVLGHVLVGVGDDVLGRKRRFFLRNGFRLSKAATFET